MSSPPLLRLDPLCVNWFFHVPSTSNKALPIQLIKIATYCIWSITRNKDNDYCLHGYVQFNKGKREITLLKKWDDHTIWTHTTITERLSETTRNFRTPHYGEYGLENTTTPGHPHRRFASIIDPSAVRGTIVL